MLSTLKTAEIERFRVGFDTGEELSDCVLRSFREEDRDGVVEGAAGSAGSMGSLGSGGGCGATGARSCTSGTLRVRRVSTAFRWNDSCGCSELSASASFDEGFT